MGASNQATITQIGARDQPRLFSLAEAEVLLPIVKKLTALAYNELNPVKSRMQNMLPTDPRLKRVEHEYETVVRKWVAKMERLGVVVKGLWLIDFDTGDGYLCWRYPEFRIGWFHEYETGFGDRQKLADVIEQTAPEWV